MRDGRPRNRHGRRPPLIIAGLRDGAALVFDLDVVVADPNRTLDAYQRHELWPYRAAISSLAAAPVRGALFIAWTTENGWILVQQSWEEPLRGEPDRVRRGPARSTSSPQ